MNKIKKVKLLPKFQNENIGIKIKITDDELKRYYSLLEYQYKTISIKEKNKIKILNISSILYIKSSSNYSTIYLTTGKEILTSKTLKYWESKIANNSLLRCHNSFLINAKFANCIDLSNNRILVKDTYIPISKPNKKLILDFFSR